MPKIDLQVARNCPVRVLSVWHEKRDNIAMDEMLKYLKTIGLSDEQCAEIREKYDGDLDGLTEYVLICVAHYDDRHEYV